MDRKQEIAHFSMFCPELRAGRQHRNTLEKNSEPEQSVFIDVESIISPPDSRHEDNLLTTCKIGLQ